MSGQPLYPHPLSGKKKHSSRATTAALLPNTPCPPTAKHLSGPLPATSLYTAVAPRALTTSAPSHKLDTLHKLRPACLSSKTKKTFPATSLHLCGYSAVDDQCFPHKSATLHKHLRSACLSWEIKRTSLSTRYTKGRESTDRMRQ